MLPDWAPKLTEAWASAYLQILFGMLVFAIGIPALITQLIVQEDIRQIAQRRHTFFWVGVCIPILLASLLFVWLIHPTGDDRPAAANTPAASRSAPGGEQAGSPPFDLSSNIAAFIITVTPLFSLALFFLLRGYEREAIVKGIRKKLLGSLSANGCLDERKLGDLLYLGEKGKAGREKDLVLEAIKEIVEVARQSAKYKGDQLDELLHGLRVMLANQEKPGDDGNFDKAAYILQRVKDEFPTGDHLSTRDNRRADDMLKLLGTAAVGLELASAPFTFLQFAGVCEQDMVFEIGLSALRMRRFDLAVAALGRLEAMAAERGSLSARADETTAHLLGLLAHFAAYSFSTCRQAERVLHAVEASCSPSLSACLDYAFDFHYEGLQFDTSDSLVNLRRALHPGPAGLSERLFAG